MRLPSACATSSACSIVTAWSGTTGRRRRRPTRGWMPSCSRRSISSTARAMPASSDSTRSARFGDDRVDGAMVVGIGVDVEQRRAVLPNASPIAAITARSRPSDTFGTDSSSTTRPTLRRGEERPGPSHDRIGTSAPIRRYPSIGALQRDLAGCRRCVDAGLPARIGCPSSTAAPAGAPTSTARRRASSRERKALPGGAAPVGLSAAGSSWTRTVLHGRSTAPSVTRCYPGRAGSAWRPHADAGRAAPLLLMARRRSSACSARRS